MRTGSERARRRVIAAATACGRPLQPHTIGRRKLCDFGREHRLDLRGASAPP